MQKAAFLMRLPLFAVISVVRKFNLKTSIGGVILAKRRIDDNETPFLRWRYAVSITAKRRLSLHETKLNTNLHFADPRRETFQE